MVLEGKIEKALANDWSEEHDETEEEILMKDIREVLNRAVENLPMQQRQVYTLCQLEGFK